MQLSDLDVRPLQLHILALMVAARYVAAQMVQTRRERSRGRPRCLVSFGGHCFDPLFPVRPGPRGIFLPCPLQKVLLLTLLSRSLQSMHDADAFDTIHIILGRKIAERMHLFMRAWAAVGLKSSSALSLADNCAPAMLFPRHAKSGHPIARPNCSMTIVAERFPQQGAAVM